MFDIYNDNLGELVDDDSIDGEDEAFMRGWDSALDE